MFRPASATKVPLLSNKRNKSQRSDLLLKYHRVKSRKTFLVGNETESSEIFELVDNGIVDHIYYLNLCLIQKSRSSLHG